MDVIGTKHIFRTSIFLFFTFGLKIRVYILAQSIYVKHSNPQVKQKPEQKHSNHSLYFRKQKPSLMKLKHSCLTSTTSSMVKQKPNLEEKILKPNLEP